MSKRHAIASARKGFGQAENNSNLQTAGDELTLRQAKQRLDAGNLKGAELLYRQLISQGCRNHLAYCFLALICGKTERYQDTINLLETALKLSPKTSGIHHNMGMAYQHLKQYENAIKHYQAELELTPERPDSLINLGNCLIKRKQPRSALAYYKKALPNHSNRSEVLYNIGNAQKLSKSHNEAINSYHKVLELAPNHQKCLLNLGITHLAQGEPEQAAQTFHRLIKTNNQYGLGWYYLAKSYLEQDNLDESIGAAKKALDLAPKNHAFKLYTAPIFDYLCEFKSSDLTINDHALLETRSEEPDLDALKVFPFFSLHHNTQHGEHKKHFEAICKICDLAYPEKATAKSASNNPTVTRRQNRKNLRIGFVSADFHDHVVSRFVLSFLPELTKQNIEIYIYSNNKKSDQITNRFKELTNNFHHIHNLETDAAHELISSHALDTLIDLSGHTQGNRLDIFAKRAAPIQASWLGYPGSTGLQNMDYIFIDQYSAGGDIDVYCREKIATLEGPLLCFKDWQEAKICEHLPENKNGFITLGTLNHPRKYSEPQLDTWAKILHQIPNSKLLIARSNLKASKLRNNILKFFDQRGISESRILLEGLKENYLDSYNQIDISLDTFPYTGTTTTIDSLWMGVPVVTLTGDALHQKASASLLAHCGYPEWIASDIDNYIAIAVHLAKDKNYRLNTRRRLRNNLQKSPLCNTKKFATTLLNTIRRLEQEEQTNNSVCRKQPSDQCIASQ